MFALLFSLAAIPLIMVTWYVPIFEFDLHLPNKISEFDYNDLTSFSSKIEHSYVWVSNFFKLVSELL